MGLTCVKVFRQLLRSSSNLISERPAYIIAKDLPRLPHYLGVLSIRSTLFSATVAPQEGWRLNKIRLLDNNHSSGSYELGGGI